jgi:hypothetical protein
MTATMTSFQSRTTSALVIAGVNIKAAHRLAAILWVFIVVSFCRKRAEGPGACASAKPPNLREWVVSARRPGQERLLSRTERHESDRGPARDDRYPLEDATEVRCAAARPRVESPGDKRGQCQASQERVGGCGRARRYVELTQDIADVTVDRPLAQAQRVSNRPVGPAVRDQAQHVELTSREPISRGQFGLEPF